MPSPPLAYAEFAPGAAVQDLVVNYWRLTVRALPWPGFQPLHWPDGCVCLAVVLTQGQPTATPLVGPRRTPCPLAIATDTQCWGVRFRPEMGPAALGRPADAVRDQQGPAHHWFGGEQISRLERAIVDALAPFGPLPESAPADTAVALAFDRWLFDAADATVPPDRAIRDAVRAIVATEGAQPIATIAELVGISVRHLQRGFKEAVGLSPKEYAMLRRSRHALSTGAAQSGASGELVRVARASGFADGVHLAQDFGRLMHGTSAPLRQRLFGIEHSSLLE